MQVNEVIEEIKSNLPPTVQEEVNLTMIINPILEQKNKEGYNTQMKTREIENIIFCTITVEDYSIGFRYIPQGESNMLQLHIDE